MQHLKCWVHPDIDAIGVCKSCGKGVCKECALTIRNETYCKTCVEASEVSVGKLKPVKPVVGRSGSITVASILFFIFGVVGFIGAITEIIHVFAKPFFAEVAIIGGIDFIVGLFTIYAGKLLWDNKKDGGIFGILMAVIALLIDLL